MNMAVSSADVSGGEINAMGKLYRFLALCFAHPDDTTLAWLQGATVADELMSVVADLPNSKGLAGSLQPLLQECHDIAGKLSADDLESTYIAMFACGYPDVLCPPYGSLYTAKDDDNRLENMISIKSFYENCGLDIAGDFKDLPDHICVQLEFLQYLSNEETQVEGSGKPDKAVIVAGKTRDFIEQYTLGLLDGMTTVAAMLDQRNLYCVLIEVASKIVRYDGDRLLESVEDQSPLQKGGKQ